MFLLNMQSKDPIFQQIRDQLRAFIEAGVIREGDKLPSVRQLARDNAINPNTVAKAYKELEELGIIYTLPKKGAYARSPETGAHPLNRSAEQEGGARLPGTVMENQNKSTSSNRFATQEGGARSLEAESRNRAADIVFEPEACIRKWKEDGVKKAELLTLMERIYDESKSDEEPKTCPQSLVF